MNRAEFKPIIFDLNSTKSIQYGIEIESAMPYSRMVATHPWFNIQMKDGAAEKFRFRGWDPNTIRQVFGYIKEKYPHIETRVETWAV